MVMIHRVLLGTTDKFMINDDEQITQVTPKSRGIRSKLRV